MRNRIIALLLCLCILLQLGEAGLPVYAQENAATEGNVETTESAEPDFSENLGKYATFNIEELGFFDFSSDPASESLVFTAEEIPADLTVVIVDWRLDELEGIWYLIEAAPGYVLPDDMAQNPWVLDGYVGDDLWSLIKFDPPQEEIPTVNLSQTTEQGIAVGVSGELPEGTQLLVQDGTLDLEKFDIQDPPKVLAVLDISLLDEAGAEYQPYADEKTVTVTIDAEKLGLSNGDVVRLRHEHDGEVFIYDPFVVIGGKLTFVTDKFSLYVVEDVRVENKSVELKENSVYEITVGQSVVFWGDFGGYGAVWQVDNESEAIDYTVLGKFNVGQSGYAQYWAQWIKITGQDVGEAKVTFVVDNNRTHTATVRVKAPDGLSIENRVAESGCLVPLWSGDHGVDPARVRYVWTRDDGQAVHLEALRSDGSVNISIDRGGATNQSDGSVKTITYILEAIDIVDGTTLGKAEYEVLYGNEILNPSFEKPGGFSSGHYTFYNGYPGLFWKTTAPGQGGRLTQDIEMGHVNGNPYGINSAHGSYFVELNAEEFGALYQDMLTTPGATLTWQFNHAKRWNSQGDTDRMYVIVAATDYARKIVNKDNIDALLDEAVRQAQQQGVSIPDNNSPDHSEGFEFTFTNKAGQTGTYRIWFSQVAYSNKANEQWKTISGSYQVPEGQYLTRLFFASDTNDRYSANSTLGNMIDAVAAGEFMSYIVEYYKGDVLQSAHTELGEKSAYEQVTLQNLSQYLDTYKFPYEILINGRPYPGTIDNLKTGLLLTDYGTKIGAAASDRYADRDIVLQIVFHDPNIRVTKIVEIEGWQDMTPAERQALLDAGIKAKFKLTNVNNPSDTHTTEVTITQLSDDGRLIAAASFRTITEADFGKTFRISETFATAIQNYAVTVSFSPETVTLSNQEGGRIQNITATNRYIRNVGNLTIKKDVVNPSGYTAPADDVFTLVVSGPAVTRDRYWVSINNQSQTEYPVTDGKLTINLKAGEWAVVKNLDLQEYQITELPKDHYVLTSVTGETGTIVKENSAYAGFVNTYAPKGNLEIHKFVDVGMTPNIVINENQEFTFTLTLDNVPDVMNGPYAYTIYAYEDDSVVQQGDLTLQAGNTLSFQLKHNQYIRIAGLPETQYTLVEAPAGEGYQTPYYYIRLENATRGPETVCVSQIPKGDTEIVECYNPIEISNGDLRITKQVQCEDDDAVIPKQPFVIYVTLFNQVIADHNTFQVEYSCDPAKGTLSGNRYTLHGDDKTHVLPTTVTAEEGWEDYIITLELYDGLTATIKDIPPSGFVVSEKDYSTDKFATSWVGETSGFVGGLKIDGKNPVASVTCVNRYNVTTGQLNITKRVKKEYERDIIPGTEFVFTVTPAENSGIILVDGDYTASIDGVEVTATAKNNKLTVRIPFTDEDLRKLELNDSQMKVLNIKGLPFGSYVVTEEKNEAFRQSATTMTATVGASPTGVNFTNTYKQHLGEIRITKTVSGTAAADPVLVQITGEGIDMLVPVVPGTQVVIYDLPLGVTYTVTEITDWNWRYTADGATVQAATPTLEQPNCTVSFHNVYTDDQWLSDTDVEPNTFG